jgi:hypothetical protein
VVEALRAAGMATGLRRLTAAAGWQDRSFAIALDLLRSDDAGSLLLVTAADGLTLDHLADLVGDRKDELPGPLRKRLEPRGSSRGRPSSGRGDPIAAESRASTWVLTFGLATRACSDPARAAGRRRLGCP